MDNDIDIFYLFTENRKMSAIGLALGSGAVHGLALIPAIKRLEHENIMTPGL